MGLSESGAHQVRTETSITAATITPAPAKRCPRLARPKRRKRKLGCTAARRAGAFTPRPLWRISFSIGFSIRSTPLPEDPANQDPARHQSCSQAQREQSEQRNHLLYRPPKAEAAWLTCWSHDVVFVGLTLMEAPESSKLKSSASEPYWMTPIWFWALPVLAVP
jgi:hypothetical protein